MPDVPETPKEAEVPEAKARNVGAPLPSAAPRGGGPDPVIGAGITLLGIFSMGVAGAAGAHYAFNVGTLVACIGAVIFVLFVALSALSQRDKVATNGG